jgi:ribosomal protein S18 acetylase RimI-like enzyme
LGYTAMQFNMVLASNAGAIRLWQRLGFDIVGMLPLGFDHPTLGLVDGHVMWKAL